MSISLIVSLGKTNLYIHILSPENKKVAGGEGIEPSSMVLETTVLPLYYTPSKLTFYPIANKSESKGLKQ